MGTLTVTNSTFAGNSAGGNYGGGAIVNGGTLTVTNSTFSGNSAGPAGGALYNWFAATLTNCTLSENGGAISNAQICSMFGCGAFASVTLTNTVIAESAGVTCRQDFGGGPSFTDGGHNLQWPGTSCGETIQSLDPKLDPNGLKDNGGPTQTIALAPDSPAIDAGDPDVCANPPVNGVDQRCYVRPGAGHTNCSIGAYEAEVRCAGDCNNDDKVAINELIVGVNIALGRQPLAACPEFDENTRDGVEIHELVGAVGNALNGCPMPPTPAPTRTPTITPTPTETPTMTPTASPTVTGTRPSATPTSTSTKTATRTRTFTRTVSPKTPTPTRTATATPTS